MTLESDEIAPIPEQEPLRPVEGQEPPQVEDSETPGSAEGVAEDSSDIQQIIDGLDDASSPSDGAEEQTDAAADDSENSDQVAVGEEVVLDSGETVTETAAVEPADIPLADGSAAVAPDADRRGHVPVWPFVVYDLVWALFAAVLVWQFAALPAGMAPFDSELYAVATLVGVGLTAFGLILIVAVWLYSRTRYGGAGIFVASLTKGAIATIAGVALWWAALIVVDYVRLGSFF